MYKFKIVYISYNQDSICFMRYIILTEREREQLEQSVDNAPIHKSKKFIANITCRREQDLYIYFLPPYLPKLNKIEIRWRFIKYLWIPLGAYSNFQNIKDRMNETLLLVCSKHIIKYY